MPLPLSHCRSCDTYYPSARGECRWCGTTGAPEPRIAPNTWVVIAVIVVAGGSLGGWALWKMRDVDRSAGQVAPTVESVAKGSADPAKDTSLAATIAATDSAAAPAAALTPDTTMRRPLALSDTAIQGPAATGSTGSDIRWVTATAITWSNVRSEPSRQSGIVAVISPDTRVRLGDAREGWRRVKAGGIEGWVDPRLFAMDEQRGAR